MILLEYAKENRFPNPTFFVDDGYSGTNYDRAPGFQAMLAEIEAGRVAVCITKDLSRLGRNSSLTGLYINFTFPKYNVRYIAVNDHFDTPFALRSRGVFPRGGPFSGPRHIHHSARPK